MDLLSAFPILAQSEAPFSLGWDDLRAVGPALILLLTGSLVLLIDLFLRGWQERSEPGEKLGLHFLSLLGTVAAAALAWASLNRFSQGGDLAQVETYFRGAVEVSAFTSSVSLIILLGTFLSLLVGVDYLRRFGIEHGEFHCLVLYGASGMILFAQSANLIMLFLSLETLSMAVYVLSALTRDQKRSVEGALKYFILGGFSSGFLLLGFAFLYGATGEIELRAIVNEVTSPNATPDVPLLLAGLGLSVVGLGFKVGSFPFHSWVPDAYEGAPAVVTGFMAVTVKAAAIAVLLRLLVAFGGPLTAETMKPVASTVVAVLSLLAAATMVFGNVVALVQNSVKRMLAYSAIAHTGYLLVGVVAALSPSETTVGASQGGSVVFYLLPYSLMTVAAFALLGAVGGDGRDREQFADYRGLSQERPGLALALLVIMVSFAGIPPFAGFWAKLYVFRDAVLTGHISLALLGVITSVVSVYFYLRLVVNFYMQPLEERPEAPPADARLACGFAIAAAAVAIVILGILPDFCYQLSVDSVAPLGKG